MLNNPSDSNFGDLHQLCDQLDSVLDYIRFSVSQLNQHDVYFGHGTDNAFQEATTLVFGVLHLPLDISAEQQSLFYPSKLTQNEKLDVLECLQRRCEQAIPLPYLLQQAWFGGMPFYVDERVLIPRSPFAELIEKRFASVVGDNFAPNSILDMCTGGAPIAIMLAHYFQEAQVDAVDIDADALDVASININEYQLQDRVFPLQSDLFANLQGQQYDLIVVNPPYVDAQDMHDLPQEYHHEPEAALASGEDGLDLCEQILREASNYMSDQAWLFVEVGNSEVNFAERFPNIDVHWCELHNGGSGIFAINKQSLVAQLAQINN